MKYLLTVNAVHGECVVNAIHGGSVQYLLAVNAVLAKLPLVAGCTVDILALGQEALAADGQLALVAGEAVVMPHVVLILHVFITWGGRLCLTFCPATGSV